MSGRSLLVIEDDEAIREGLVDALTFDGHRVAQAADAKTGLEAALRNQCDLVLLDLMLPHGNGFDILKEVRRIKPRLPIIILTARGSEADRVRGLRMGADDYVVKPFSVRELLARVDAVLRRMGDPEEEGDRTTIEVPGGLVDLARREIRFEDGDRCELTDREVAVLAYLGEHGRRVVGRDELLQQIWRIDPSRHQTRTVDMQIARLREKLRDPIDAPRVIITVRGKGYKFGQGGTDV